jgi:hypothetical protein
VLLACRGRSVKGGAAGEVRVAGGSIPAALSCVCVCASARTGRLRDLAWVPLGGALGRWA